MDFSEAARQIAADARILPNFSPEELRRMAKHDEQTTEYGSANYITAVRSRSAKFTEIAFNPDEKQKETLGKVAEYLKGKELISIDRIMCMKKGYQTRIRLFVTSGYARLAYMWARMLFPVSGFRHSGPKLETMRTSERRPGTVVPDAPSSERRTRLSQAPKVLADFRTQDTKPDFTIIDVPEWPERKILVDPINYITFILGSDYCGEIKKAGLRMMMYAHKTKKGGLGLHAGSKIVRVRNAGGRRLIEKGMLLFGLSATGKTTLTCHYHWLDSKKGELVRIRQDDVVLLNKDGSAVGTEDNFYIKTDGLEPESQPLLYKGATSSNAILENVKVDEKGKIDFFDSSITSNGRGIVIRKELDFTDESIDLEKVDMIVFITRRKTIVPPIARLTPEQAAAFFMLGESVESSAGDPTQAGKPLRVVGTNPFIIGPLEEEGNRFLDILRANPKIECFLLDTGRFGAHPGADEGVKITVYDSARLLADAARGTIKWKKDPDWGYDIAESVADVDMAHFDASAFYGKEEYAGLTKELKEERRAWLAQFKNLYPEIRDAI